MSTKEKEAAAKQDKECDEHEFVSVGKIKSEL